MAITYIGMNYRWIKWMTAVVTVIANYYYLGRWHLFWGASEPAVSTSFYPVSISNPCDD
jgi:hypothetical protein